MFSFLKVISRWIGRFFALLGLLFTNPNIFFRTWVPSLKKISSNLLTIWVKIKSVKKLYSAIKLLFYLQALLGTTIVVLKVNPVIEFFQQIYNLIILYSDNPVVNFFLSSYYAVLNFIRRTLDYASDFIRGGIPKELEVKSKIEDRPAYREKVKDHYLEQKKEYESLRARYKYSPMPEKSWWSRFHYDLDLETRDYVMIGIIVVATGLLVYTNWDAITHFIASYTPGRGSGGSDPSQGGGASSSSGPSTPPSGSKMDYFFKSVTGQDELRNQPVASGSGSPQLSEIQIGKQPQGYTQVAGDTSPGASSSSPTTSGTVTPVATAASGEGSHTPTSSPPVTDQSWSPEPTSPLSEMAAKAKDELVSLYKDLGLRPTKNFEQDALRAEHMVVYLKNPEFMAKLNSINDKLDGGLFEILKKGVVDCEIPSWHQSKMADAIVKIIKTHDRPDLHSFQSLEEIISILKRYDAQTAIVLQNLTPYIDKPYITEAN